MIVYFFLCIFHVSSSENGHCVVSNVHVTKEDGVESTMKVKQIHTSDSRVKSSDKDGSSTYHYHAPTHKSEISSIQLLNMPPVIIDLEDLVPIDKESESPLKVCQNKNVVQCLSKLDDTIIQSYADYLVNKDLIPLASGDSDLDKRIGYGHVLLHMGKYDEAIQHFNKLLQLDNELAGAYYGRGTAYAKKDQGEQSIEKALNDFNKVIELENDESEGYEKKAEVLIQIGNPRLAMHEIGQAMKFKKRCPKLFYLRGIVNLVLKNLTQAEKDLRESLKLDIQQPLTALYHLAITLFNQGKVRNAIQVFKEALKLDPDNKDLQLGLGQAYKEIGNVKQAEKSLNGILTVTSDSKKNQVSSWLLKGQMEYNSGNTQKSVESFKQCLDVDKNNYICQYYHGVAHVAMGQYFQGVKDFTKVIVYDTEGHRKLTPEFLKSHYLREYARYLHMKLNDPVTSLNIEADFTGEMLDHWIKRLPFDSIETYIEKPGIQPLVSDVHLLNFEDLPQNVQKLLCRAEHIGNMAQVKVDGFFVNRRLNTAMGLATIHIAQYVQKVWSRPKGVKINGKKAWWQTLFGIAVQYRRLVDPESLIIWLNKIKYGSGDDNQYKTDITFISGQVVNIQRMQYFDLVFKLFKSMLTEYKDVTDLDKIDTAEDLIKIARMRSSGSNLFMSTQVPSTKDKNKHFDGILMSLTTDQNNMVQLALSIATMKSRSNDFHSELDFIFTKLHDEIKRNGIGKIADVEGFVNLILSLAYYFYNLMPLSKGTSAVAYSVLMGLLLSVGREVTVGIPQGKLMDMEAMLSGAPDAFILVAKQWMNIKKSSEQLSTLPKVWEVLPTLRNVLEVLSLASMPC